MKIARAGASFLMAMSTLAHAAEPDAVGRGQVVFEHWCEPCHGSGTGRAGTTALAAKYDGRIPAELARRTDMNADFIRFFLRNGVSIMPFFRKTEITPAQEADLIAFLTRDSKP